MAARMKRKESLDLEPKGSWLALEINQEKKKRKKMVVIFLVKEIIVFADG